VLDLYKSGVHKSQVPGHHGDCVLCSGTKYMCMFSNQGGLKLNGT